MPPLLTGLLSLVGLTLLSVGLGRRLLRLLKVRFPDSADQGLMAAGIGFGALQAIPFALFSFGIGTTVVFRIVVSALTLTLIPDIFATVRAGWRERARCLPSNLWQIIGLALFAIIFVLLLIRAVCPAEGGDALGYHLTTSFRYLKYGRFVYLPTLTPTNWPIGMQLTYALLLGLHRSIPPAIAGLFSGILVLFSICRLAAVFENREQLADQSGSAAQEVSISKAQVSRNWLPWIAVLLIVVLDGSSVQGIWEQMSHCYVDLPLTLFTTLALICLIQRKQIAATNVNSNRLYTTAAIMTGLAGTAKLTGLWVLIAILLLQLWDAGRGNRVRLMPDLLKFGVIATAVQIPHYLRTWALTGNPIYPMLYKVFGGLEWTASGWERFQRNHMMYNTPPGMMPTPFVLTAAHGANILVGALICALILWRANKSRYRLPAAFAGIFLLCICLGNYLHTRFLLPIFPAVAVCLAGLLRGRERYAVPVILVLACLQVYPMNRKVLQPELPAAWSYATGQIGQESFLRERMPDYAVTEWANSHLPTDSRILVGTYAYNLAYYKADAMWCDYWLQDSFHYDSLKGLIADFRRMHTSYLVLDTEYPENCAVSHSCRGRLEHEPGLLTRLAAERGTALFSANGHTLYQIRLD